MNSSCADISTICPQYSDTPASECVYITQPTDSTVRPQPPLPPTPTPKLPFPFPFPIPQPYDDCTLVKGHKLCTTCIPGSPLKRGSDASSVKYKLCQTCTRTSVPLVPPKNCAENTDCVLAAEDCSIGCGSVAVHASQKKAYHEARGGLCDGPGPRMACGRPFGYSAEAVCNQKTKFCEVIVSVVPDVPPVVPVNDGATQSVQ